MLLRFPLRVIKSFRQSPQTNDVFECIFNRTECVNIISMLGLGNLICKILFIAVGLCWPSFMIYNHIHLGKSKRIIAVQKHFVVVVLFFGFTTCLDFIFGSNTLYTLCKIVVLYMLIRNNFSGSTSFFDNVLNKLPKDQFIIQLALKAMDSDSKASIQMFFAQIMKMFAEQYDQILNEIDVVEEKAE